MAWASALQCGGHQHVPAALNVRIIGRSHWVAYAFIERRVPHLKEHLSMQKSSNSLPVLVSDLSPSTRA